MDPNWRLNREKRMSLVKFGIKYPTALINTPPSTRRKSAEVSTKKEILSPEEEKQRKLQNEASWNAWRLAKDVELKKNKNVQASNVQEQTPLNKKHHSEKELKTQFKEWKRNKKMQRLEEKRANKAASHVFAMKLKLLKEKRIGSLHDKALLKAERTQRLLHVRDKKIVTQRSTVHYDRENYHRPPKSLHLHTALLESKAWVAHGLLRPRTSPLEDMSSNLERIEKRNAQNIDRDVRQEARLILQKESYRADTLFQLRLWKCPTPEIYILSSILHKILYFELNGTTTTTLLDPWMWLPWKYTRLAFENTLASLLTNLDIATMKSEIKALLYIHCAHPKFKLFKITARSTVGGGLRTWLQNVAYVHGFVDDLHKIQPIDSLVRAHVDMCDVARVFLMTQVYPHVKRRAQVHPFPTSMDLRLPGTEANKYAEDSVMLYTMVLPPKKKDNLNIRTISAAARRRSTRIQKVSTSIISSSNGSCKGTAPLGS